MFFSKFRFLYIYPFRGGGGGGPSNRSLNDKRRVNSGARGSLPDRSTRLEEYRYLRRTTRDSLAVLLKCSSSIRACFSKLRRGERVSSKWKSIKNFSFRFANINRRIFGNYAIYISFHVINLWSVKVNVISNFLKFIKSTVLFNHRFSLDLREWNFWKKKKRRNVYSSKSSKKISQSWNIKAKEERNDQKFQGKCFQLHYDNTFRIHFRLHDFTKVPSWKSGGEGEEVASTCSVARVRVVVLNFTLFKGTTIEATRERKVTPRPHPPLLGELYKDLNNFEWDPGSHNATHGIL